MDKVFKKKYDIPPPPKLPTPSQIIEDLKAADPDDPVFFESSLSPLHANKGDENFRIAKDFMTTTAKLKELETLLTEQKSNLESSFQELEVMSENIRKQATEALSSVY